MTWEFCWLNIILGDSSSRMKRSWPLNRKKGINLSWKTNQKKYIKKKLSWTGMLTSKFQKCSGNLNTQYLKNFSCPFQDPLKEPKGWPETNFRSISNSDHLLKTNQAILGQQCHLKASNGENSPGSRVSQPISPPSWDVCKPYSFQHSVSEVHTFPALPLWMGMDWGYLG